MHFRKRELAALALIGSISPLQALASNADAPYLNSIDYRAAASKALQNSSNTDIKRGTTILRLKGGIPPRPVDQLDYAITGQAIAMDQRKGMVQPPRPIIR